MQCLQQILSRLSLDSPLLNRPCTRNQALHLYKTLAVLSDFLLSFFEGAARTNDFASKGGFFILCGLCDLCGNKIHADAINGELMGLNLSLIRPLNV